MPDSLLGLPVPASETPFAFENHPLPTPRTAVIVASDQFALQGIIALLAQVGSVDTIEAHDSLDTAMAGPTAALIIVHAGAAGLNTPRVAALVNRRQAGALLAAGCCGSSGLAALRAAGACGLLTGQETPGLCASLFQLALAGGSCWPAAAIGPEENRILPSDPDPALALTARQWEVAVELVHGHSNKVIAATLGMTEGTVKIHLTAVYRTLGVSNRATALLRLHPILGAAARPVNSDKQSGDIR